MIALSIRQPWAWAILNLGKDIENRRWRTNFRGTFLIHASSTMSPDEYRDFISFAAPFADHDKLCALPDIGQLPLGGIVGQVELTDCVAASTSPWFTRNIFGFTLANPVALPFKAVPGQLRFFEVPA